MHGLNDTSESSDYKKAGLFNQFFHSIFSTDTDNTDNRPNDCDHIAWPALTDISFTEEDVFNVLNALDVSKAIWEAMESLITSLETAQHLCQNRYSTYFNSVTTSHTFLMSGKSIRLSPSLNQETSQV